MFTIKIINQEEEYTYLRQWPDVNIHDRGSDIFQEQIESAYGNQSDEIKEHANSHTHVLISHDAGNVYYLCDDEEVFITDYSGKTVYCITR